ncbi:MAG: FAD-dependent oxidoreductase [Gammaproteobacteria bacterium]|nr:FAD-dependent oxidoreductase [Gammaproteobacteria bacterium]
MKNISENVVIVGASHAAAEAISTLRRAGWEGQITLIGDEVHLPYQRPPLSKAYYKGDVVADKIAIKGANFYEVAKVDLVLGKRAESIDRVSKVVILDDGTQVKYSKLILATGTRARLLPVEGADAACIKYLRTMGDVDNIKASIGPQGRLLIVGAGYIGLEVAASAVKQGIDVTVLEAQDRVLARVTSEEVSTFYQDIHRQAGVNIRLEIGLKRFLNKDGSDFAELENGELIKFDCAIVGIGVIPNVELAEQAGLACDNGIVVDEFTRTEDHDIYAVGDCSNHPSPLYQKRIRLESVPNAVAQAKTAALSICGDNRVYDQLPWFWSDQYDVKLQTAGLMQGYDETLVEGDVANRKFTVSYMKNGKLIALDAINSPAEFMKAKKRICLDLVM